MSNPIFVQHHTDLAEFHKEKAHYHKKQLKKHGHDSDIGKSHAKLEIWHHKQEQHNLNLCHMYKK